MAPELIQLSASDPDAEVALIIEFSDGLDTASFLQESAQLQESMAERRRRLIHRLREQLTDASSEARALLPPEDAARVVDLWIIHAVSVRTQAGLIPLIAALPQVASIRPDQSVTLFTPSTQSADAEWGIDAIGASQLWTDGHRGQGVTVGIIDSGVDVMHTDLGPAWRGAGGAPGTHWEDFYGSPTPVDPFGHGTQVAGVILGGSNSGSAIGVAPDAKWVAYRAFDGSGTASLAALHAGLQWMLALGDDAPQIINNSWGLINSVHDCETEFIRDTNALQVAGISVVFAAGNNGPNPQTDLNPGNLPWSLPVGAVDQSGQVAFFSARGPSACLGGQFPQIVAPGVGILTSDTTFGGLLADRWIGVSGTSFSAPHMSGALALLRSANPALTSTQAEMAILSSAVDLPPTGPDSDAGYGRIELVAALAAVADDDGDGSLAADDCDDADASIYPGAPEIAKDGIDQNCDGVDLSIEITRARLLAEDDRLIVHATSDFGAGAGLRIRLTLMDGREIERGMKWKAAKNRWQKVMVDFVDTHGTRPVSAAVFGSDGEATEPIDVRAPPDGDGDGFDPLIDCDDGDPAIFPGAVETKHDGIDQDCNGFDLTIDVIRARYVQLRDQLVVRATSSLGGAADLAVTVELDNGSSVVEAMVWKSGSSRWQKALMDLAATHGGQPVSVTVSGIEGTESSAIEVR